MNGDVRFHGMTENRIEYFAFLAGAEIWDRYAFSIRREGEGGLRVCCAGNEFVMGREGIGYRGNGGTFCEYMFGIDRPLADLTKGEVANRLAMYGAGYGETGRELRFTDLPEGEQSYDRIFFDGNAVCNYFFFVNTTRVSGAPQVQQRELLRLLGKAVKRSPAVGREEDDAILTEILALLDDPRGQLFLFKLINKRHQEYRDLFASLYYADKKIADNDFARLTALAASHRIDRYQQERIRVDVMYKHPVNRRIVDEYRNILIGCNNRGECSRVDIARLTRLKTLSVRNKIPDALFYPLDETLRRDVRMADLEENSYLAETREILEGLFLRERHIESTIDREDMVRLLFAKRQAADNRDYAFEEIILDTGRACDEKIHDGADMSLLEGFSSVITFFDRYDATSAIINRLAFMENVRISEEVLRSLLRSRREFDALRGGLFEELFISGLYANKYLGNYGRKKVGALVRGLRLIEENRLTIADLLAELHAVDREERLFLLVRDHVRDRVRNLYSRHATRAEQDSLREDVREELRHKGLPEEEIPDLLFREAMLSIKKEVVYLQSILPRILAERDTLLREDFLENSGLDRFFVEELEREYFELNCLEMEELYQLRRGGS